MRITGLGQVLFGLSFAMIGALSIGFHDFALAWELLPGWMASHDAHHALDIICGALLLIGGTGLLIPRMAIPASLLLTGLLLLRLLLLHAPRIAGHPLVEGVWESMSENLIYLAGVWTIFAMLSHDGRGRARSGNARAGQVLFALATPAIGLSHFFYLNMTAPLIPAWLPFHVPLAYFTGVAWIAAGVGIFFGVLPRLAATLAAVMVSLFTLLVWVPAMIAAPLSRANWGEICTSAAITGAAWAVAESFRSRSWSFARSRTSFA